MDLNELFFRHQIALMRAGSAGERGEKHRHAVVADGIATRIGALQLRLGAPAAPLAMATAL